MCTVGLHLDLDDLERIDNDGLSHAGGQTGKHECLIKFEIINFSLKQKLPSSQAKTERKDSNRKLSDTVGVATEPGPPNTKTVLNCSNVKN